MSEAADLLRAARSLMSAGATQLHGCWPRAVALLGRQALEGALDDMWAQRAPGVQQASRTAQLLCLSTYLEGPELVRGVRYAWHALSRACHHHAYELPPTAVELDGMLAATERLVRVAGTQPTQGGSANAGRRLPV